MTWRMAKSLDKMREQFNTHSPNRNKASVFSRLMTRIDVRGPSECWPWTGGLRSNGYGTFGVKRAGKWTQTTAHRAFYVERFGEIPGGWEVDHKCRNRACMNPSHLEAVSVQENRKRRNAAKTHCGSGHEYTQATIRWQADEDGYLTRVCRICENARHRSYHDLARSEVA